MERKPLPDLMKGLAVVLMVQVHIMELFVRQEVYDSVLGKVSLFLGGPFAAPVFLAVMGYFLAASRRSAGSMAWRGIKLLGLGLLLNVGLNMHLLIKILNGTITDDPWKFVLGVDILFAAGLSILGLVILKKIFKKNAILYISLAAIIPVITYFIPEPEGKNYAYEYIMSFLWMKTTWSYFPLIPWFSYPLMGYAWHLVQRGHPRAMAYFQGNRTLLLIILAVILSITSVYPFRVITHLPAYYHHEALTFLWIMGFIAFLAMIMDKLVKETRGNAVVRYLGWLGKNVTAAYVVQWLIIGNIATSLYKTQFPLGYFLWFLVIMALTSLLTSAWIRLKVLFQPS